MMLCADRSASYGKAEPLEKASLEIYQKVLGKEHPNTATAMARLAFFYEAIWDFSKAELLLKESLKIDQKVLGPKNPVTLGILNNLAVLYFQLGQIGKYAKDALGSAKEIEATLKSYQALV